MNDDRRTHLRHAVPLECAWSGASGLSSTRISDLSVAGCYVDSSQVPIAGEHVEITFALGGTTLRVTSRVVHAQVGMGFAARFEPLDDPIHRHITRFLAAQ